jgi:hypothetical protein
MVTEAANVDTAVAFLTALIAAVPYRIHTVPTMVCSSATCPRADQGQPHAIGCTNSTAFAMSTASTAGSLPIQSDPPHLGTDDAVQSVSVGKLI